MYTSTSGFAAHAEGEHTSVLKRAGHAEGFYTIAQNDYMHAAGKYNIGTAIDTIHETGIGTSDADRKNAFEIYTDGRIIAPELTTALINTDKSLVTKEYVDAQGGGTGGELKKIIENGNEGYGLQHRLDNPDNYGDIGENAVDFSISNNTSTINGATGTAAFAAGVSTTSSGYDSFAEGYLSRAAGDNAHAEGYATEADGYASHSEGYMSIAIGEYGSHAEGFYTTAKGDYGSHSEGENTAAEGNASHAEGLFTIAQNKAMHAEGQYNVGTADDTIHETGIGTSDTDRKNGFEIYTDGTLTAPEADPADLTARGIKSLVTIEYLLSPEFGNALPTTDPGVAGQPWNDAGILKISAG
jgi:predicted small secreted protein